jgi:hypothetical protein
MKRPKPDTRLDWRDPQMPVLRRYRMPSGEFREVVDPDYEHRYRAHLIEVECVDQRYPDWRKDPTYTLRRKK